MTREQNPGSNLSEVTHMNELVDSLTPEFLKPKVLKAQISPLLLVTLKSNKLLGNFTL